MFKGS
jgi:hypothetical protein